jgi:hypothetical protein
VSTPAGSRFEEHVPRQVVCDPQPGLVRFNDATVENAVDVPSIPPPQTPIALAAIAEEQDAREHRSSSSSFEEWTRFCAHCGNPIPWERLVRVITSRARVFFCCDSHRFADANAKNKAAKRLRQAKGVCPSCHGRGYTRVNRPQRPSKREIEIGSDV